MSVRPSERAGEAGGDGLEGSSVPRALPPEIERSGQWVGRVIADRYRVARRLGAGGMGEVYEAEQIRVKRRLAIKFLLPQYCERASMLTRFRREAEAAGRLEHENIAAAIDFGDDDGVPYLVMEFLEGVDLARLLRDNDGRLPAPRAVELVLQSCRGVAEAHAHRIVHRDLKPQNLFVCRRADGSDLVKILDFGVAKLLLEGASAATQTAAAPGTPCYMSPEQARGDKRIDARTDVYSLGLILYECLTGTRPYAGDSYNAVLHQVLTRRPEPLGAMCPRLPGRLVRAVDRAIEFEPQERWPSIDAFAEELRRVQGELAPRSERHAGPIEPGLATEPAARVPTALSTSPATRKRAAAASTASPGTGDTGDTTGPPWIESGTSTDRPPRWKLVVAVVAGAVAVSTGWALSRSSDRPGRPTGALSTGAVPLPGESAGGPSSPAEPSGAPTPADGEVEHRGRARTVHDGGEPPTSASSSTVALPATGSTEPARAHGSSPPAAAPTPVAPSAAPQRGGPAGRFDRDNPYE